MGLVLWREVEVLGFRARFGIRGLEFGVNRLRMLYAYSRSLKVANPIASILKSKV